MKSSAKLMALASVCILIAASGALVLSDINEAEASNTAPTRTVTGGYSANLTQIMPGFEIVSGSIPGVTFSYTIVGGQPFIKSTGTFTKAGTYTIASDASWSITFIVLNKSADTRTVTCGDSANLIQIMPGFEIVSGSIPGVTFSYTIVGGQPFLKSTGTFTKAGTYTIVSDASWSITFVVAISTLEIPYVAPNSNATANVNWSYTPTTESGVTVTVSGVDWLSFNGTNLYGVPPATGEYNITIHMSKQGFTDRTETFTLNVISMLVVLNSPNYGVIMYLV